jgi:hypothetical protein
VNELQLHERLSALAADLASDADPYAQADGARALHRRRRRTRIGVAGAAAVVAAIVVGVPTAVGGLSAPDRGDVARPSPSSDPLRGSADAVRSALAWWEADGAVPDPELGRRPCSDAAEVLPVDSGLEMEPSLQPRGSTTTACVWSTDGSGNTPPEARVDLTLSVAPDLDAHPVMAGLDEDAGCPGTILFRDRSPNVLRVCESDGQQLWELTVVDDDGTGAWVMTAAVGDDVSAGFDVGARSVATLWGIVPTFVPEPSAEEVQEASRRVNEAVDEGLRALSARPDPRLYARPGSMECRDGTAALSGPLGPELTLVTDRPDAGLMDCAWVAEPAGAPVTVSIRFLEGVDGGKLADVTAGAVMDSDFHGTETVSAGCFSVPVTAEGVGSSLAACDLSGGTQLVLGIEDAGGAGVWVLLADVPPDSPLDAASALVLVVGAAEQAW